MNRNAFFVSIYTILIFSLLIGNFTQNVIESQTQTQDQTTFPSFEDQDDDDDDDDNEEDDDKFDDDDDDRGDDEDDDD